MSSSRIVRMSSVQREIINMTVTMTQMIQRRVKNNKMIRTMTKDLMII
jgi:hypothetical protein